MTPGPAPRPATVARAWPTWLAVVVFGGLSAALGWWIAHRVEDRAGPPPPAGLVVVAAGEVVPDLRLPDLRTGTPRPLVEPGRPRLLNYWASWCAPCREEMPLLDAFAASQGVDGVEVVGIALDSPEDAGRFLAEVPVAFPLLVETPGPADSSVVLGNRRGVLPFTALVDADGRLLATHYGPFPDAAAIADWVSNAR